jgi:hypothetical protein
MRESIPSDYIDKEGNVYETVGENIREGKNGAVTSDFPTPEEIGNGLVGSDGVNYVVKAKNLADTKSLISSSYVLRFNKGEISYELPVSILNNNTNTSTPPMSKAVIDYVMSKLPYLQNAKTGIVVISISESGSASIVENEANLNIYVETGSNTLRILSGTKHKNIIDSKVLKCTTDSTSNFNVPVNTFFSAGNNSLFKEVNIANIKSITLLLSVEV